MSAAVSGKAKTDLAPGKEINGRRVAPALLPTFSFGQAAPLLRLYLEHYEGPADSPLTVKIMELDGYFMVDGKGEKERLQEGGKDAVLATFYVTPLAAVNADGRPGWANPKPEDPSLGQVPEKQVPYFRLTFAARNTAKSGSAQEPDPDCPVFFIPLDKAGEEEDGFEIGYRIEDPDGNVQAPLDCNVAKLVMPACPIPRAHDAALLCADFAFQYAMETRLAEVYSTRKQDQLPETSLGQIERRKHEEFKLAAKKALEQLDEYLKVSETAYASHLRHYREYYELLAQYIREVGFLEKADERDRATLENRIFMQRKNLEEKKRDLDAYLAKTDAIPKSYLAQSDKIREAREKSQALDKFLDDPVIRVITLLPGGSLLTSVTQIAQGKYQEAFVSAGLDLLTYGSFKKLEVMADLFRSVSSARARGDSLCALLTYRYMNAALGNVGKLDNLLAIASKGMDPGYAAFFEVYRGFKSLKKNVDGIVNLGRARKALVGANRAVQSARKVSSPEEFISILKASGNYHDFLLAADYLRTFVALGKQEEKIIKLVDHFVEDETMELVKKELVEIKSLGRHAKILPSAKEAVEAGEALESLFKIIKESGVKVGEILAEIPSSDLDSRCAEERMKGHGNSYGLHLLADLKLNASQEELTKMLEEIKWAFKEIIPVRAAEARAKSRGLFSHWDWKKCRFDFKLEKKIDKLTDQLQARMHLMGFKMDIRDWFYSRSIPDEFGNTWIYDVGFSDIGIDQCESAIRHLALP